MVNIKVELLFVDGTRRELTFTPRRLTLTRTLYFLLTEALGPKTSRLGEHNDKRLVIEVTSPKSYYPVAIFTFETEKVEDIVCLLQAICLYGSIHGRSFTDKHSESSPLWPLFEQQMTHLEKPDLRFILMYVSGVSDLELMLHLAENSMATILDNLDTEVIHTMPLETVIRFKPETTSTDPQ